MRTRHLHAHSKFLSLGMLFRTAFIGAWALPGFFPIDPATIRECDPVMVQDLPANEKRFIQKAIGIEMTIVNGEVLEEKENHTGRCRARCSVMATVRRRGLSFPYFLLRKS